MWAEGAAAPKSGKTIFWGQTLKFLGSQQPKMKIIFIAVSVIFSVEYLIPQNY